MGVLELFFWPCVYSAIAYYFHPMFGIMLFVVFCVTHIVNAVKESRVEIVKAIEETRMEHEHD